MRGAPLMLLVLAACGRLGFPGESGSPPGLDAAAAPPPDARPTPPTDYAARFRFDENTGTRALSDGAQLVGTLGAGVGWAPGHHGSAIAFDPNVPRIAYIQPQPNVIVGGTYTFDLAVADTTGLTKVGYRATAPGFSKGDSTLFAVPYPKGDTITYSFQVPSGLAAGTNITITPFAENRDALRGQGEVFQVRIAAAGPDLLPPVVYQTVPPRLETPDSIDLAEDREFVATVTLHATSGAEGTAQIQAIVLDPKNPAPALRSLGPASVYAIGLGCMNLSHAYGAPPPPAQAEALLHHALDLGVTMLDTAALYGFGANETLLGRALKGQRHRFVLASKGVYYELYEKQMQTDEVTD